MTKHICEVCHQPSTDHRSPGFWPPLCCDGCPCDHTHERVQAALLAPFDNIVNRHNARVSK